MSTFEQVFCQPYSFFFQLLWACGLVFPYSFSLLKLFLHIKFLLLAFTNGYSYQLFFFYSMGRWVPSFLSDHESLASLSVSLSISFQNQRSRTFLCQLPWTRFLQDHLGDFGESFTWFLVHSGLFTPIFTIFYSITMQYLITWIKHRMTTRHITWMDNKEQVRLSPTLLKSLSTLGHCSRRRRRECLMLKEWKHHKTNE